METQKNQYQLSKTIRFGLTLKKKISLDGREVYQSHSQLRELVKKSEDRVRSYVTIGENKDMSSMLDLIIECTSEMKNFLSDWRRVSSYKGQIELDKDFYKSLAKKIGFYGFKRKDRDKSGNTKVSKIPQARSILLNTLPADKGYDITNYWADLLLSADQKWREATEQQSQFAAAIAQNRDDRRPNQIELKKTFLAFASIVTELLCPIINGQLTFAKLDKLDSSKSNDKFFLDFAGDNISKLQLLSDIDYVKAYFNDNGANVHYCRATLNEKTALKDKHSSAENNDISSLIHELRIDEILRKYENADDFMKALYKTSAKEKIKRIDDFKGYGMVYRALLFKYKQVPSNVRRDIANTLSDPINAKEEYDGICDFLRDLGTARSPQKDYADLADKSEFNIESYPLKVAFDFAWEGVAKSLYHENSEFPIDMCKQFLREHFDVQESSKTLKQYASMLELNALLSTLDKGNPSDRDAIVSEIESCMEVIDWQGIKNGIRHKENISHHIKSKSTDKQDKDYNDTKRDIAMMRGRLKNEISKYDKLTKSYKDISMRLGNKYAEMREKIMDANEHNRVTHLAMIVEDENLDRYLLLQEVVDNESDRIFKKVNKRVGLPVYYVNSITSSAVAKILRKLNAKNKPYNADIQESDEEREERMIMQWSNFIRKDGKFRSFDLNIEGKSLEQIKKEIDAKCYKLESAYIDRDALYDLVQNGDCLLLPIVNQDIAKKIKTENNQFTKDWNAIISNRSRSWRLTPEFRVTYRNPVPGYPTSKIGDKRYSRFQMNVHFLCDFIPQTDSFCSNREQIQMFKDVQKQEEMVKEFNRSVLGDSAEADMTSKLNALGAMFNTHKKNETKQVTEKPKRKYYVFGIDRGQKELATLCVIDQDKKIVGNHEIYTRYFNSERKQWEHKLLEERRHILDLSNLRVETTIMIDGKPRVEKVLVDQSTVKVKDKNGNYVLPDMLQVKMQQMAYIRKLQYQMQTNPEKVLAWYEQNNTDELIITNLVDKENGERGLISFYGCAVIELKDTLPVQKIKEMLEQFKSLKSKEASGENVYAEIKKLVQLDPVDNFKAGVVANMVGVIAHLLKKYDYQVYISLEDLSKKFKSAYDGNSGRKIQTDSGRQADVERYSGLGLYNFFEMQLLRKLFKIQQDSDTVLHLVPAFRAQKNYDHVAVGEGKIKNQFGVVFFVDADQTSICCPKCGATNDKSFKPTNLSALMGSVHTSNGIRNGWVDRDKEDNDRLRCYHCGFDTKLEYDENPLKFIKSGDDNAAYLIADSAARKAYELATTLIDNNK